MKFVEEEDGFASGGFEAFTGFIESGAEFLNADHGGVELDELSVDVTGDDAGERGFSAAWGTVKDDGLEAAGLEHASEEFSWSEEVGLSDVFVEISWAHACGKGEGLLAVSAFLSFEQIHEVSRT